MLRNEGDPVAGSFSPLASNNPVSVNPPKSHKDICIGVACIICNGASTYGSRRGEPAECQDCAGTGWMLKPVNKLSETERQRLLDAMGVTPQS